MNEQESQNGVLDIIVEKKGTFLLSFFVVFLLTYSFLAWLDFLPEPVSEENNSEVIYSKEEENNTKEEPALENIESKADVDSSEKNEKVVELPEKIIFESLKREVVILNPTSRDVVSLDEALLQGVVRHPDSATLGQNGAVFILGHSSYLPTVINKNFQAFNGIQNLKWGENIKLVSGGKIFVYKVDKVYRATATDTTVPIASDRQRLILATCNSFGSVDDRYVVEADLLEVLAV